MSSFETVVVVWSVVVVVVVVVVAVVPRDGCPELRSSTIPRFWTQGKVTPKVKGCAPRGQHLWNANWDGKVVQVLEVDALKRDLLVGKHASLCDKAVAR